LGETEEDRRSALLASMARACAAGVDWICLREKDLAARELERLAREVVAVIKEEGGTTKLLVHTRSDVALAVGADGVHLASGDQAMSPSEVRALWMKTRPQAPLIGVSCHTAEEIARAEAHGADFAVFGPVFEKAGVQNERGLTRLEEVCRRDHAARPRMPVLALGGVTTENEALCVRAGAAGIAAIRLFQTARRA
jgi:thiamine-phosphate pyrophosphorylase